MERTPIAPALLGALIALAVLLGLAGVELASGELPRLLRGESGGYKASEYRFSITFALLLGYLPAAYVWTVRASRRAFAELRPVLQGSSAELDEIAAQLGRFDRRVLRRVGGVGVAVGFLLPLAADLNPEVYGISELNSAAAGHRIMVPILMWLMARITWAWMADARRLVVLSRERLHVDLLDPTPLAPLTRLGLRNALISLGSVSIVSLMTLDWASRPGLPWVLGGLIAAALLLGLASLLLPLRGAHSVIQAAKQRELDWCRDQIRLHREALATGGSPTRGGSLDELVAYHGLVREVRAWPFDASTLLRFGLYLVIPVGSWMGGALVERWLDILLD